MLEDDERVLARFITSSKIIVALGPNWEIYYNPKAGRIDSQYKTDKPTKGIHQ